MSSAANPQHSEPPYHRERRRDDMPGQPPYQPPYQQQQQQQTQDVVIDRLTDRLSAIFQPQLKDIKDQLANLVTRREHEKDLAEITADMSAHQRQLDRLQTWADVRPRESADAAWVKRIEADVQSINARLAQQPAETRAWFNTANSGLGTLIAIVALLLSLLLGLLPHLSFH